MKKNNNKDNNKKDNNNKDKSNGILMLLATLIAICALAIIILQAYSSKNVDDKTLAYTDLIKQISVQNIEKIEMTTGSTTIKVTLKKEIDENGDLIEENENIEDSQIVKSENNQNEVNDSTSNITGTTEQNSVNNTTNNYANDLNSISEANSSTNIIKTTEETKKNEEVNEKLIKTAIVPNIQSFIELIQEEVANGNNIELIQKIRVY